MRKRILFVAMHDSIHTARWANQLCKQQWEKHIFPVFAGNETHPELRDITVHHYTAVQAAKAHSSVVLNEISQRLALPATSPQPVTSSNIRRGALRCLLQVGRLAASSVKRLIPVALRTYPRALKIRIGRMVKENLARALRLSSPPVVKLEPAPSELLRRLIQRLKPDIVHSLEIQHAGYLTLEVKQRLGGHFPTWIVTNWGSDIYHFARFTEHAGRIRSVLQNCDYYSCECHRDVAIARDLGLRGTSLPVLPNAGGFDLNKLEKFRSEGPVSARRLVVLKGYQHWAGRALIGIEALRMCAKELRGYRVAIYSTSPAVQEQAEAFARKTHVPVEFIPHCPHHDLMRLLGKARIFIGLSISDGICTSMLEAAIMGAFPIQSCTACVDEWIKDGVTGSIVPPEDPKQVAVAIRGALLDDSLVDRAAAGNAIMARERLDVSVITPKVVDFYDRVFGKIAA